MRGRDFSELPAEGGTEGGHSAPPERTDKDLPIGYRETEDPDEIEVFYCVSARCHRADLGTSVGRVLVAVQIYEAAARVAHERMVAALLDPPEYEEREPLSKAERTDNLFVRARANEAGRKP